jgi:hypothetical protein
MINFGVRAPDFERVQALLSHIPGAAEKAMSRAINKAINSAKTEAIRDIKGRYAIGDAEIRRGIKVIPSTANHLAARLIAVSAAHRVAKFEISKAGDTVQSEIVSGNKKPWPAGFITRLTEGHIGLFARDKEYTVQSMGRYANRISSRNGRRSPKGTPVKRQSIFEAMTLRTPAMMGYHEVIEKTLNLAEEKLQTELDRQIGLFLQGDVS